MNNVDSMRRTLLLVRLPEAVAAVSVVRCRAATGPRRARRRAACCRRRLRVGAQHGARRRVRSLLEQRSGRSRVRRLGLRARQPHRPATTPTRIHALRRARPELNTRKVLLWSIHWNTAAPRDAPYGCMREAAAHQPPRGASLYELGSIGSMTSSIGRALLPPRPLPPAPLPPPLPPPIMPVGGRVTAEDDRSAAAAATGATALRDTAGGACACAWEACAGAVGAASVSTGYPPGGGLFSTREQYRQ
jgi:hypothetical protein